MIVYPLAWSDNRSLEHVAFLYRFTECVRSWIWWQPNTTARYDILFSNHQFEQAFAARGIGESHIHRTKPGE